MADELVYTSMPRGLKPGSRGFCVVASTANLSPRTLSVLESLSAYRHLQTPVGGPHPGNPVAWSHFLLPGEGMSILSRVADSGLDYSGRTNKLAHHIVLDHAQRSPHGPAAMLAAASNLMTSWSGDPRILPPRNLQPGRSLSGPCSLWQSVAGDVGWAGELARNSFNQPRTVVISAGDNALGLVNEAMSLVPPQHRWRIGFTTFDNGLPQDVRCHWRFVIAGSAEHVQIQKNPPLGLIDLTATLGPAPESNEAKMARSGDRSSVAATVSQVAASPPGMARPATGRSLSDRSVSQKVAAFQAQTGQAADDLVLAPLMPQRLPPAAPGSVPVRPKASSNSASTKEPRGIGFVLTLVALTGCLFLVLAGGGVWFAMQRLTSQEPANTMTIDRIVEQQEIVEPKVMARSQSKINLNTNPPTTGSAKDEMSESSRSDASPSDDEVTTEQNEINESIESLPDAKPTEVDRASDAKPKAKSLPEYQLAAWDGFRIDQKHSYQTATLLELRNGKYVPGNTYEWVPTEDAFCEVVTGIVSVNVKRIERHANGAISPVDLNAPPNALVHLANGNESVLLTHNVVSASGKSSPIRVFKLDGKGDVTSELGQWTKEIARTEITIQREEFADVGSMVDWPPKVVPATQENQIKSDDVSLSLQWDRVIPKEESKLSHKITGTLKLEVTNDSDKDAFKATAKLYAKFSYGNNESDLDVNPSAFTKPLTSWLQKRNAQGDYGSVEFTVAIKQIPFEFQAQETETLPARFKAIPHPETTLARFNIDITKLPGKWSITSKSGGDEK